MTKVITYGTFDVIHQGHIRLLERAKNLGDYLIVGITADDFDKKRGKINVKQSLTERIEAVRATGLADKIIVEEYEGQKIDDIKRYEVDIFTVGSDWVGKFDYLNEYCEVIYLDRTEGISSSKIRSEIKPIRMGLIGNYAPFMNKIQQEDKYVNGLEIVGICTNNINEMNNCIQNMEIVTQDYKELLEKVDAIYLKNHPSNNYQIIKDAIMSGKHVLCESAITDSVEKTMELFKLAQDNDVVLMDAIRTAYSTAYYRLLLLIKGGIIGKVLSVDATCTSINNLNKKQSLINWGPTTLLPVFQILGVKYKNKNIISHFRNSDGNEDTFSKIDFIYNDSVATIKVAEGAKSEGELIVTGDKGYIYVPAPWWKTDYFEVRFEDSSKNKRYFYQLDGEGIRYELVAFARNIQDNKLENNYIANDVSLEICKIIEDFNNKIDLIEI